MKILKLVMICLAVVIGLLLAMSVVRKADNSENLPNGFARSDLPEAIIFVPGLYGSTLVRKDNQQKIFLTLVEALFGTTPLGLSDPKLAVHGAVALEVGSVMEGVTILPHVYTIDVYGSIIKFLRHHYAARARIMPLGYDWREDNIHVIRRLSDLVDNLKAEGVKKISLIGHSMGGLVISHYLRFGAQDFADPKETWEGAKKVGFAIVAGVPYGGATAAYRNIQQGISLALAKTPLNSESYSSFWAAYQLMPLPEMNYILNKDFESLGESAFAADIWNQHNMAFLHKDLPVEIRQNRFLHIKKAIRRGIEFKRNLQAASSSPLPIPLLVIKGHGQSTFTHAVWTKQSLQDKGAWLFTDEDLKKAIPELSQKSVFTDGDGTVPFLAQSTPEAYAASAREILTKATHSTMYTDPEVQKAIVEFLE